MKKNVFKLILLSSLVFSTYNCSENEISNDKETASDVTKSSNTARIPLTSTLNLPLGITDPTSISWNESTGLVQIIKNVNFSNQSAPFDNDKNGFYWNVPNNVKKILIKRNVTVTGGFRLTNTVEIAGEDRGTCIIFGTPSKKWAAGPNGNNDSPDCSVASGDDRAADCQKWTFGAISGNKSGAVYTVKNLTIRNARTYAITSFESKIVMENVFVNSNRTADYGSNADGISAGKGSSVKNCKFDVWDDSIKLYKDMTVENVTIVQNSNGAAFQLGWGGNKPATTHTLKNILVVNKNSGYSNLTVFAVSGTNQELSGVTINLGDFSAEVSSGLKLRNTSKAMPMILSHSTKNVKMTFNRTGTNYKLVAPAGFTKMSTSGNSIGGSLNVSGSFCSKSFTNSALNMNCGNSSLVKGCGW